MSVANSPRFLSMVLLADAALSLTTAAAQLAATEALAGLLHVPTSLLTGTGWFFVAYAALVAFVGTRRPVPRAAARLISVGNFGWAALCALALLGPWLAPTSLGTAWILGQAAVVVLLGELQWMGLKRATPAPAWA